MLSADRKAGIFQDFKFPEEVRSDLLRRFGGEGPAERLVQRAEQLVALHQFTQSLNAGEPANRKELRQELQRLAKLFDDVSHACRRMSASAEASIRGHGGAYGVQFSTIAKYFLEQSTAAASAAADLKGRRGDEPSSDRYLNMLVQLADAHHSILSLKLKPAAGTAGHELALQTLKAAGHSVAAAQVERMLSEASKSAETARDSG